MSICSPTVLINVDPSNLLQIPLADNIVSLMSLNICSLKSNFLNLQLEITDNFRPSVIGICETKMTNEIETLHNIAGYDMFTNYQNLGTKFRKTNEILTINLFSWLGSIN